MDDGGMSHEVDDRSDPSDVPVTWERDNWLPPTRWAYYDMVQEVIEHQRRTRIEEEAFQRDFEEEAYWANYEGDE